MAPLQVDLHTVPESRAVVDLALATNRLLAGGQFSIVHSQGTTRRADERHGTRRHRIAHVVTLHETFRAEQFAGVVGGIKQRAVARALRRSDAVIAVSGDARDNLLAHLPLGDRCAERVHVIRNGVAVDILLREAPTTRLEIRQRYNIAPDVTLLGYIGRFMPEKGFDILLDAVASAPPGQRRRQVRRGGRQ